MEELDQNSTEKNVHWGFIYKENIKTLDGYNLIIYKRLEEKNENCMYKKCYHDLWFIFTDEEEKKR